jgi:hypothetical protein
MSKLIDDDSPTTRRLAEVAPRQQPMAYVWSPRRFEQHRTAAHAKRNVSI